MQDRAMANKLNSKLRLLGPADAAAGPVGGCEIRRGQGSSASFLLARFLRIRRTRLTVVVFDGGDRIGARQPAVQVDVGAAARTKRAKTLDLRLTADRTGFRMLRLAEGTHAVNLGFA
jgi:hypothetical protein